MHALALSLCLFVVACTDDPTCPEIDQPVDGHLLCHTHAWLAEAGFSDAQLVVDARTVVRAELPDRPGWSTNDDGSLVLGRPSPYFSGQHAFFSAGGLELLSFTNHDGTGYLQTIEVDPAGVVTHNGVDIIPR